jgi:hypothetical protein
MEFRMTHAELIKRLQNITKYSKDPWFNAEIGSIVSVCWEIKDILEEYLKDKPNDDTQEL